MAVPPGIGKQTWRNPNLLTDPLGESFDEPYMVYQAIVRQAGVAAPVAQVKRNTFPGDLVWSYVGVGIYRATLTGCFPAYQTAVILQTANSGTLRGIRGADDYIQFTTQNAAGAQTDAIWTNGPQDGLFVEIRVYAK